MLGSLLAVAGKEVDRPANAVRDVMRESGKVSSDSLAVAENIWSFGATRLRMTFSLFMPGV